MKKIIEGKRYDTETATEIAAHSNNLVRSDFRHINESLYVTGKGRFFLAGEGGPMTKYAVPCGDMSGGGSDIRLLTRDEAMNWCERHGFVTEAEEHFADVIQDA